jgi:uncharacterized protein YjdB
MKKYYKRLLFVAMLFAMLQIPAIVLAESSESSTSETSTEVASSSSLEGIDGLTKGKEPKAPTSTAEPIIPEVEDVVPTITYQTHVQKIGWQDYVKDGETSGTTGLALRLEGIKIRLENGSYPGDIKYSSHVQDIGWQEDKTNDTLSGTTGQAKQLEGIRISLTGEIADHYDIYYRVHIERIGWLDWAKNGEEAGSQGMAARLEGIQIKLVVKGTGNLTTARPFINGDAIKLTYQVHGQGYGWQGVKSSGQIAGTTGQAKRLEAIALAISGMNTTGNIHYTGHVQDIGWQGRIADGGISGTTGRALQLEALEIDVDGDVAKFYDIYYRGHVQDKGWLGWTKNGGAMGSTGVAKRLEAIEVRLILKGRAAPPLGQALVGSQDFPPPQPQRTRPYYYSQRDSRWSGVRFNDYTIGPAGCVPTSLAMILKGTYGMDVNPADVARKMDPYSPWSFGASGSDIIKTANAYGHATEVVRSQARANQLLSEGYPLIFLENVGIGHAVATFGNSNGNTEVFDPYDRMYFNGWYSINYLFTHLSNDSMDWDAGYPVIAIK